MKNIYLIVFLALSLASGCNQPDDLQKAKRLAQGSESLFQQSVALYHELIAKGKDLDKLNFELGKLYFSYGKFDKAITELKKSTFPLAKKYLVMSYYHLGNFTDAYQVFSKFELDDDEYIYFVGLTSEKLNLFDRALAAYASIKGSNFSILAKQRMAHIEKKEAQLNVHDIAPVVSRAIALAPQESKYPQAGALILLSDEKVEIGRDNSEVSQLHYLVKILNQRGKEEFSETHIEYDSTYEKIELEFARTIKPDGSIIEVGSRHLRDVSKYLNFPLYSNARVYIISFPEVTEGAVLEYKVKIYRNELINKKDFVVAYTLQSNEPIINAHFTLTTPRGKNIRFKNINTEFNDFQAELEPVVENIGGDKTVYRWSFKDLPQIIPEARMPPLAEINPTMLISSFPDWQDIYNWWQGLFRDKIRADAHIKKKVKELIFGLDSDESRARAIYNFCAQKIRYVAVEYGQAGYEPHQAEDTFRNKYGDCKDQAILLVTMLKEAGFSAWPVLIGTRDSYNLREDFPAVLFNHCIAVVTLKDKYIFLDPTAETCSFRDLPVGDQGRRVLIFKENGYEIYEIPNLSAENNLLDYNFSLSVNADESIVGNKTIQSRGVYQQLQRYWFLYTQPELIREELIEKIQDLSIGAQLQDYTIENMGDLNKPVELKYSFSGPEYFTRAGSLRIMPQLAALDAALVAKEERRYPLDLAFQDIKLNYFEIQLPANLRIKYLPQGLIRDNPWFKLTVAYNYKENKIYFKQRFELKKKLITRAEYPDFRLSFSSLAKELKERIILEKVK
ncbi:MAG: DUF3857 domain-containing protein [Candidatus Omnitrophota bacterium]|nr:DUF3857 domain-containing protein [Candidatus Omnitrophota bacterium]